MSVIYKGKRIKAMRNGQEVDFKTVFMQEASQPEEPETPETPDTPTNQIEFTIDGTIYYAERDMKWGDWVKSEYNTGEFWENGVGRIYSKGYKAVMQGDSVVTWVDVIVENFAYTTA